MTPDQKREERVELSAAYLNTMAAGFGVGSLITVPIALITRSAVSEVAGRTTFLFAFIAISLCLSVALHLAARELLRKL